VDGSTNASEEEEEEEEKERIWDGSASRFMGFWGEEFRRFSKKLASSGAPSEGTEIPMLGG
jgi:hypothetical protein